MSDEKLHELQEEICTKANDLENKINNSSSKRPAKYGLCSTCMHFHYKRSIYDNEIAICAKWKCVVPQQDRICECTDYYPFDQPDIFDMTRMATLVEYKKDKKIGF